MNIGLQKEAHTYRDIPQCQRCTNERSAIRKRGSNRIYGANPAGAAEFEQFPDARPFNLRRDRIVPIASRLHKESEMAKHSRMKYSCHL